MPMNYDNDMTQGRKNSRRGMMPSLGSNPAQRLPMPIGPSALGTSGDVLRNIAGRRGKLRPTLERPMLPTVGARQFPLLDQMPVGRGVIPGFAGAAGAGIGNAAELYDTMDLRPSTPSVVANVPSGRRKRGYQPSYMVPEIRSNPEYTSRVNDLLTALNLMSGQGSIKP